MRVLFLINSMAGGGAERSVLNLLRHLDPERFDLSLALFRAKGEYLPLVPGHVSIIDLSAYDGRRNILRRVWGIKRMVDEHRPDVVVSSLVESNCSLLRAAPLIRSRCRLVVTTRTNLQRRLENRGRLVRVGKALEIRLLYPLADRIIAISHGIEEDLVHNWGLQRTRTLIIHNPIDIAQTEEKAIEHPELERLTVEGCRLLVAAGRLVSAKGYPDLLRAFAKVRQKMPCRLLILGEGPLRPELEMIVKSLGLSDAVCLPGFIDNPWAVMARADVYVSSSHWEGFHNTIVEAMACGTPVVATDCDYGPREIITHGSDGLLVPVGDVDALANQLIMLLNDDEKRSALAVAGKQRALAFDAPVIARQYERMLEGLFETRP